MLRDDRKPSETKIPDWLAIPKYERAYQQQRTTERGKMKKWGGLMLIFGLLLLGISFFGNIHSSHDYGNSSVYEVVATRNGRNVGSLGAISGQQLNSMADGSASEWGLLTIMLGGFLTFAGGFTLWRGFRDRE